MTHLLKDRTAAGQRLVARLTAYADRPDALVLALPRGGVPVAAEVARALRLPLDVLVAPGPDAPAAAELQRRERAYRDGRPPLDPAGKIAIVVDDGMATGATMLAALAWARQQRPARLVVAVPVAALKAYYAVAQAADQVECLAIREPIHSIAQWYGDFRQLGDEEVREVLRQARFWVPAAC